MPHAPAVSGDEAFLAGLLHEAGKLYVLLRAKDHRELFGSTGAFRSVVDEWQARIGAAIMRAWDLPDPLTEIVAIANHLAERFDSPKGDQWDDDGADFGALSLDRETLDWMLAVSATDARQLQAALAS